MPQQLLDVSGTGTYVQQQQYVDDELIWTDARDCCTEARDERREADPNYKVADEISEC